MVKKLAPRLRDPGGTTLGVRSRDPTLKSNFALYSGRKSALGLEGATGKIETDTLLATKSGHRLRDYNHYFFA